MFCPVPGQYTTPVPSRMAALLTIIGFLECGKIHQLMRRMAALLLIIGGPATNNSDKELIGHFSGDESIRTCQWSCKLHHIV